MHARSSGGGDHEYTEDQTPRSRFTYRDLKLLSQSSVKSQLRVITLIDFDCFYAQCESVRLGLSPDKPLGVQQFKHVIAINYAARAAGLKKVVTAEEAKRKCPEIVLQHVPTWREGDTTWRYRLDALEHMDIDKSSLDYYRLQSKKAMALLKETLPGVAEEQIIEKAGIDETYVDLSRPVYEEMVNRFPELSSAEISDLDDYLPMPMDSLVDWKATAVEEDTTDDDARQQIDWDDEALLIGCEIVNSIRTAIHNALHYTCSAGIACNKVLAKLAAGHNKPNRQTVVRNCGIASFLSAYKFTKIRGLGGKLGRDVVKTFNTESISDLLAVSRTKLTSKIGGSAATWVYNVIRGIEHSEVTSRTQLKSVLSAKTFMSSLQGISQAEKWLFIFAADIIGRLEELGGYRRPKTIAVHLQVNGPRAPMRSKQGPIPTGAKLDIECLLKLSKALLLALEREGTTWPLVTLSVSVNDLQDMERGSRSIDALLLAGQKSLASHTPAGQSPSNAAPPAASLGFLKGQKRTLFDFNGFSTSSGNAEINGKPSDSENKRARPSSLQPLLHDNTDLDAADSNGAPGYSDDDGRETDIVEGEAEAEDLRELTPKMEGEDEAGEDESDEGVYDCPSCNKAIPASSVLEHLDWHAAVELSVDG